jgi:hypothetical protein
MEKDNNLLKTDNTITNNKTFTETNSYYMKPHNFYDNHNYNMRNNIYGVREINNGPDKIIYLIDRVLYYLNVRENVNKVFNSDRLIQYILTIIKIWMKNNFPETNKIFFKDKTASFNLSYTHYTSGYYTSQNNDADYITYKSILNYTIDKKCSQISYLLNQSGEITYFDNNNDIPLNKYIYITTTTTTSNNSIIYNIEIYSYNIRLDKIHKFIEHCSTKYKNKLMKLNLIIPGMQNQKYYRYVGLNNTAQATYEDYKFQSNKTFDNIFFTNKNIFLKKINFFNDNKKAYSDLGIPYSLGIIFYGSPGTGKTSCIKALANYCNRHIIDINFAKIRQNKELRAIFYDPKINGLDVPQHKRMYVFEEFDCIIENLKERGSVPTSTNQSNYENTNQVPNLLTSNIQQLNNPMYQNIMSRTQMSNNNNNEQDNAITLDSLLNLLDGCIEHHGPIFIITTNHINKIDKALIRPGRFDIHLHLDNSTPEIIIEMINHFYEKKYRPVSKLEITDEQIEKINEFSQYKDKLVWSPAKITQICLMYIDSDNYVENVINYIEDNYYSEILLLNLE